MAEEALVKEVLSEKMIRDGAELTRKLDELQWPVSASFWILDTDENRWKLMISSPHVTSTGPKELYEAIAKLLKSWAMTLPISSP